MRCDKEIVRLVIPWTSALAISTTEVFIPATGYIEPGKFNSARSWGEMRGRTGQFQMRFAVAHGNDIRAVGTTVGVHALVAADGVIDPDGVSTLTLGSSRVLRAGALVSLVTGTTLAGANYCGVIELFTI